MAAFKQRREETGEVATDVAEGRECVRRQGKLVQRS